MAENKVVRAVRQERDAALAWAARLDQALVALTGSSSLSTVSGPSIRTRVLDLLEEEDRSWKALDVLAEFERRGEPIGSTNPPSYVRRVLDGLCAGKLAARDVDGVRAMKFVSEPAA